MPRSRYNGLAAGLVSAVCCLTHFKPATLPGVSSGNNGGKTWALRLTGSATQVRKHRSSSRALRWSRWRMAISCAQWSRASAATSSPLAPRVLTWFT